jgi:hypothetical protein
MTPNQVTIANSAVVRNNLYPPITSPQQNVKPKFNVGDSVRISRLDNVFAKGYEPNYTDEVLHVSEIKNTTPITYGVRDYAGQAVSGSFYPAEMVLVNKKNEIFPVQRVINRRKRRGHIEYLVQWRGYPDSANSWVLGEQLFNIDDAS